LSPAVNRDPLAHMNEQVLKVCGLLRLSAHALHGAALILGRFLALKTKHGLSSFSCYCV
jgi:hypothetical protein